MTYETKRKRIQEHVNDTLIHKQCLINSCVKMINCLYDCGRDDDALALAKRCSLHDHSKLQTEEIDSFVCLPKEDHDGKPNGILTDEQRKYIEIHWKKNRHHPEFHDDYHQMSEIDIIEMVCDWHARSKQFGNVMSLVEFLNDTQMKRFGFDAELYERILVYCEIFDNLSSL